MLRLVCFVRNAISFFGGFGENNRFIWKSFIKIRPAQLLSERRNKWCQSGDCQSIQVVDRLQGARTYCWSRRNNRESLLIEIVIVTDQWPLFGFGRNETESQHSKGLRDDNQRENEQFDSKPENVDFLCFANCLRDVSDSIVSQNQYCSLHLAMPQITNQIYRQSA